MSKKHFRFDVAIGNPPFQDATVGDNLTKAPSIYHLFLDELYKICGKVEMIHPARCLFNTGDTPKSWNKQILNDKHFKVLYYEKDGKKIFPTTEIKGGIAITYRDESRDYGAIGEFIPIQELNQILAKTHISKGESLAEIIYAPEIYKFTETLHDENPTVIDRLSKGHDYDLKSNVFDKLEDVFLSQEPNDGKQYIKIFGLYQKKRSLKYIRKEYIVPTENLDKYKVFMPEANGNGVFGEKLSDMAIGYPGIGNTQTFISIGAFDSAEKASAVIKYIKTKFCRTLLGVKKVTHHTTSGKWVKVPMQDFSSASDIDWNQPIASIDRQLYRKYGLSDEEVSFIENKVQPMEDEKPEEVR